MKKYIKSFNEYFKTFDMKEKAILRKFHHTYRVMDYANQIAQSINADTKKAELCALFHDIARFEQWTKYKTYEDSKSVDHGNLGTEIIKNNFNGIEFKDLVLFSTKNHNKFDIEKIENEEYILYTKIVRDADKIDILKEQGNVIYEDIIKINDNIIEDMLNNKLVSNNDVETNVDEILRSISFVYDFNFKYSLKLLFEQKIFENKFHLLKCHVNDPRLEKLETHVINYINNKLKED